MQLDESSLPSGFGLANHVLWRSENLGSTAGDRKSACTSISKAGKEEHGEDGDAPCGARLSSTNDGEVKGESGLCKKEKVVENHQRRMSAATPRRFVQGSHSRLAWDIISHPRFELALAITIVLNAVSLGIQADWAVRNVGSELPLAMRATDYVFTVVFTVELLVRIAGEGCAFASLRNRNLAWNLFDVLLVTTAIGGDLMGLFLAFDANITVIRLLRLLRLARALRIIRVLRFFKDLRIMIAGIAHSARSLLWASGLLLIIIYMYAICVLQVVGAHLDTQHREAPGGGQEGELQEYYGSLPTSVYTLFGAISGGQDWMDVAQPLVDIHPVMGVFNMVYVGFAVFCVLNVITGVVVENAFKINHEDEDRVVMDMLESRKQWIQEIKDLFRLADKSNTGFVDWAEFSSLVTDVRVQAVFRRLELDVEEDSAELLFELLDFSGTGLIGLDDFAEGIQRVRGNARSIDMCQLLHDSRVVKCHLADLTRCMNMLLCWQPGDATAKEPVGDGHAEFGTGGNAMAGASVEIE